MWARAHLAEIGVVIILLGVLGGLKCGLAHAPMGHKAGAGSGDKFGICPNVTHNVAKMSKNVFLPCPIVTMNIIILLLPLD